MPNTDALRGAYCPLVVPFRDEKIDYDAYGKLIERQIAEGTHGLLVNATSGEPTMLTLEERAQLVEFVIKTSAGRRPVCAGTASESFDENASLIDRFDKVGADSILVVTPIYSTPPQRGAVSYFANLGARTKRPFLIYHIPARAGFTLTVDTLAAIKDRVPHFSGLKNTDTDIGFVTGAFARLGRGFRIFAGLELPTLPMLGIGGCGMMITASNVAPGMVSQMYETFAKGDVDGAIALNLKLYPLFRGVALESSPIPVKYMLKRLGVLKTNEHRSPMVPASPEVEKQLDKILAEIGLI
jgi:4-hydroxy-tetrahydrodipicolinate synthase